MRFKNMEIMPVLIRSANIAPMIGTMRAKAPMPAVCIR